MHLVHNVLCQQVRHTASHLLPSVSQLFTTDYSFVLADVQNSNPVPEDKSVSTSLRLPVTDKQNLSRSLQHPLSWQMSSLHDGKDGRGQGFLCPSFCWRIGCTEEQKARLKTDTSGVNGKAPGSLEASPNAHATLRALTSEQLLCSRMRVCSSGEAATAFPTEQMHPTGP